MKKHKLKIIILVYLIIGIYFWWGGGGWLGAFPENLFTFFYIVLLWPFVVGFHFLIY